MKLLRRASPLLLVLALLTALCALPAAARDGAETTILFTHDLHSHFFPQPMQDGGERGGYARLKTALDQERAEHPDALILDGGDFSIGSLIQTLYTTHAAELRTMGALGYDAVTIGNHEFDHTGRGFAEMLNAAVASEEPLPAIVLANYTPAPDDPEREFIQSAMDRYGVREGLLLERGGVKYGIFGLMGLDADDCAPTSGFMLEDAAAAAERCVTQLRAQGAEFLICLSHSGTSGDSKLSEDEQLARAVNGIDLIVSGHTHSTLYEPIVVNDTYIVSAGPYCENLGSITLQRGADGALRLLDYRLITISEALPGDEAIARLADNWKNKVSRNYLEPYGLRYDQVLTHSNFPLNTPISGVQEPNSLGSLVSDAFLWAVENLEADAPDCTTIAVTADGVLRAPLPAGEITTSQAFDVLSMGVGEDGSSGFPLVAVYLTGRELRTAAEVDASVTPIMPAAQLYMSGLTYTFNPHRMFFNRVTDIYLCEAAFVSGYTAAGLSRIEDDQLYRVVTGMYSAQMLGTVKSKSMGLLSLEPKHADGSPVTDFTACILYDENGNEIKEWYALAAYLQSFGADGIPAWYTDAGGKTIRASWSPIELLRNPNWITLTVLLLPLLLIFLAVLLIRALRRRHRLRTQGK